MCESEELKKFDGLYEDVKAQFAEAEKLEKLYYELMAQILDVKNKMHEVSDRYGDLHGSILKKNNELLDDIVTKHKSGNFSTSELSSRFENLKKLVNSHESIGSNYKKVLLVRQGLLSIAVTQQVLD